LKNLWKKEYEYFLTKEDLKLWKIYTEIELIIERVNCASQLLKDLRGNAW
jgi:hypothetical protein